MHKMMREMKLNADDLLGDYQELLVNYFRIFGNKKCCANDLKLFLDYLEPSRRPELASKLIQDTGISSTTLPQDVSDFSSLSHCFNHFLIYRKISFNATSVPFKSLGCAALTHLYQRSIFKLFIQPWAFIMNIALVHLTGTCCQLTSVFRINMLF